MAYQLIYTSYPISLTHGRTGFSTVARSADMPEKLASALERISSYEIEKGAVYSHRILASGGKTWNVLSRICDSGTDYTNRNNYIAHHLALAADEIKGLQNPAEILSNWEGWRSSWNEDPCHLENVDLTEIEPKTSLPARTWAEIFGDAAKAALLADSAATIIAAPSDAETVLKLYSESLLLNIHPEDAWNTSFTTCFSANANASDFKWKCVANYNAEAVRGTLINLNERTSPPAPVCRAADYARSGEMNNREKFNLKVSGPKVYDKKFNVIETKPRHILPPLGVLAISSGVGLAVIACTAIYLWGGFEAGESFDSAKESAPPPAPLNAIATPSAYKNATLYEVLDAVKLDIEKGDFAAALSVWDSSPFAARDPEYRNEILEDIGRRIDVIMRYSEGVLNSDSASEKDMERALKNIAAARRGLDIDGLSNKDARFETWKALNRKVRK